MSRTRQLGKLKSREMHLLGIKTPGVLYDVIEHQWYKREGEGRVRYRHPILFEFNIDNETVRAQLNPVTGNWNRDYVAIPSNQSNKLSEYLLDEVSKKFPNVKTKRNHETPIDIVSYMLHLVES